MILECSKRGMTQASLNDFMNSGLLNELNLDHSNVHH